MRASKNIGTGALLILLIALLMPLPDASAAVDRLQAREQIGQVLAQEDFGKLESQHYWKTIEKPEEAGELHWFLEWLFDIVKGFARGTAAVGELLLWILAGGIGGYLVYWLLRLKGFAFGSKQAQGSRRKKLPQTLFGLDLRPENLPQDIPAEALRLLRDGDPRAALSLLYRGALAALIQQHQLEIPDSATEGECLALVTVVRNESEADYFGRLTRLWQRLAYGHRPPEESGIERLCAQWQAYFGAGNEQA